MSPIVATPRPTGGEPVEVQKAAPTMPSVPPAMTAPCAGERAMGSSFFGGGAAVPAPPDSRKPEPAYMKRSPTVATARPVGGDPVEVQKAAPTIPSVPPAMTAPCDGETPIGSSTHTTCRTRGVAGDGTLLLSTNAFATGKSARSAAATRISTTSDATTTSDTRRFGRLPGGLLAFTSSRQSVGVPVPTAARTRAILASMTSV